MLIGKRNAAQSQYDTPHLSIHGANCRALSRSQPGQIGIIHRERDACQLEELQPSDVAVIQVPHFQEDFAL